MEFVNKEKAYDGHFKIIRYQHLTEPGGKIITQECLERGNSVAAVVYDTLKKKFIFTSQFRIGALKNLLEIVAGSMDVENESPEAAMKRELDEELGYESSESDFFPIGSIYVSPGGTSEKIHVFFVEVCHKTGDGGGVEDENILIVEMSYFEVMELLENNLFEDAKTLIGMQWVQKNFKNVT